MLMAGRRRGRQRHQALPALEPRLVDPPSDNRVGRDDAAPPGEAPEPSHQPPADEPVTQAAIPVSRQQTAGGQQHERGDPDPGGSVLSPGSDVDRRDDPNRSGQCPGVPATAGGRAVGPERARAGTGPPARIRCTTESAARSATICRTGSVAARLISVAFVIWMTPPNSTPSTTRPVIVSGAKRSQLSRSRTISVAAS